MNHSPRPWKQLPRYNHRTPRTEQIDIIDSDGRRVASVLADDTEQVENCTILEVVSRQGKADACLLEAAPDLLAALEKSLEWFHAANCIDTPGAEKDLAMFRAAIAKARGES